MTDGPTRYSFSRVTTFEQCARRFRYRYLDGVKEGFQGVEAFMGRQVHASVEWLFDEREQGRVRGLEETVAHYCDGWDRKAAASRVSIRVIKSGDSLAAVHRRGADMLASFYRDRFLADSMETLANEKHFVVRLAGRFVLQGFIDRLARDADGTIHVIDYKTGKQRNGEFAGKDAEQLKTYALAVFADSDVERLCLRLEYLSSGRTLESWISREEAAAVERRLAERIETLEASTVYPPTPGVLCRWCGYNDICDASGMGPQPLPMTGLD